MTKIHLLEETAINQIAAGEVIESPASVVKELVENAVDAGAKRIVIAVKGGGLQSIRVSDDGSGMGEEDAVRCFLRFATSKIRGVDDLSSLKTMGFRGEALAAIGAISKVVLRTALEAGGGHSVEFEGGKLIGVEPCAHTRGTTIEVRSLFYNVPARKKFQKSPSLCGAEITKMVSLLALAHPHVTFELFHEEHPQLLAPASRDFKSRVGDVLGEEFLSESISIEIKGAGFHLSGVIGHPSKNRPNRTGQYLFINQRPVHCLPVSYAVKNGYGTRLAEDRHPQFVLHLEFEGDALDVNVHPQKKEVRIRDENRVKGKIQQAIFEALEGKQHKLFDETPALFSDLPVVFERDLPFKFAEAETQLTMPMQPARAALGVVGHFLLIDPQAEEEELLLVDLEAARRRVLYHALLSSHGVESQSLMFPLTVTLTPPECKRIVAHLEELEKIGLQIRQAGPASFLIDALPSFLSAERVHDLLSLFAEEFCIKEILGEERARRLVRLCAQVVHLEKRKMYREEALRLFEELLRTPSPNSCPEGKPTFVRIGLDEIDKLFATQKASG